MVNDIILKIYKDLLCDIAQDLDLLLLKNGASCITVRMALKENWMQVELSILVLKVSLSPTLYSGVDVFENFKYKGLTGQ